MLNNKKYIVASIILIILFCTIFGINIHDNNKEYVVETETETENENNKSNEIEAVTETNIEDFVTVYISGEVNNPQVLKIENGKRLVDAVEFCGGLTKDADQNAINLALILKEENHYIIPAIGEKLNINKSTQEGANNTLCIDINLATITDFKTLPGVGDVLAQRIIDKREEIGKFSNIDQLMDVSGIGDKKFNDIKDKITIN